jgi:hypothetical protein
VAAAIVFRGLLRAAGTGEKGKPLTRSANENLTVPAQGWSKDLYVKRLQADFQIARLSLLFLCVTLQWFKNNNKLAKTFTHPLSS